MAEYKESKDNPLHRQFGVGSNTVYILKKLRQYCPVVIPIALLGILCGSVLSYYWGIIGKYVIGLVQDDPADSGHALFKLLLTGGGIAALLTFGNIFSQNKTWYRFIHVRMQMITERVDRALRLNYQMLEKPDVLDIHERAAQATGGNSNGVEGMMNLMVTLGRNLFTVIVTFLAVTVLDWRLIVLLIFLGLLQYLYYRHVIRVDKREVWDKLAPTWRQTNYMARVTQDFDYAKDIRLFDLGGFLTCRQQEVFARREDRMDFSLELWFRHSAVVQLLYLIGNAGVYGVLFSAVLRGGMSIGDFTMYLSLAMSFSTSLLNFLHRFGDYGRASLEVDDFRSFLELELEKEEEQPTVACPEGGSLEIEFHDVCYRYDKQEKNALEHLNLVLHPGEKLAVVGLNGAGKTTMIKLLLRLYDPTEGYITLNGTDIRRFDREAYYRLFSPVFQNIEVMAFPISENISMRPGEETDCGRAERAAREAGLGERIDALPRGIRSELLKVVDEDGVDLSGGEKQKLALARALYKAAPIVVLDEPTSALDALAEQRLYQQFDRMIGQKSAVYISHRLASTRFCDSVAMFRDGRLVEYGSHEELMKLGGEYAHMFELQAQYYEEQESEAGNNG